MDLDYTSRQINSSFHLPYQFTSEALFSATFFFEFFFLRATGSGYPFGLVRCILSIKS